jgi:hypothetical protein
VSKQQEEYFSQAAGVAWLWAGVLAGPVAWALSQQVMYLFATLDCSHGKDLALSPVILITLLLAAGGAFISWRNWQRVGKGMPDEGGGVMSRSRFMAVSGLLLSGFSVLVIIAEWLPVFFYRQCQR